MKWKCGAGRAMARECGTCTLCCKIMGIGALKKAAGQWCPHCLPGKGCGIYGERPQECRTFNCGWLEEESFGPEWKPEKSKIVLTNGANRIVAYVDPSSPQAWRKPPFYPRLIAMMKDGLPVGRLVFVAVSQHYTLLLPGREEEIGVLSPKDEVRLLGYRTPSGIGYKVEIRRG
jgi:hypothetical protein